MILKNIGGSGKVLVEQIYFLLQILTGTLTTVFTEINTLQDANKLFTTYTHSHICLEMGWSPLKNCNM
jgi:hypothetical protein